MQKLSDGQTLEESRRKWLSNLSRGSTALAHLRKSLASAQMEPSVEGALHSLLKDIQNVGFERVRAFIFSDEFRSFVPFDSVGMENSDAFLQSCTIRLDDNRYAQHTYESALTDPSARLYDPSQESWFGLDPHGDTLQKPHDLPWAVLPLVILGKVYGQIVADNSYSRRRIAKKHLDYLDAMGAIVTAVLANANTIKLLSFPNLHLLYKSLNQNDSEPVIVARLLTYLTCGEALSFSRGIFLKLDSDRELLVYGRGLGSVTQGRFDHVASLAQELGLGSILDRVGQFNDFELDTAMENFSAEIRDSSVRVVLDATCATEYRPDDVENWPPWIKEMATVIDAEHLLVAPVRIGEDIFGLFVVDRKWRRPLSRVDRIVLGIFAQSAASILKQAELQKRLFFASQAAIWRDVSLFAAHDIGSPIRWIQDDNVIIKKYLALNRLDEVSVALERQYERIESLKPILRKFKSIGRADSVTRVQVRLHLVLQKAWDRAWREAVDCNIKCPEDMIVLGDHQLLLEVFQELFANAMMFFNKPQRVISVDAALANRRYLPSSLDIGKRYAMIEFRDNGCGIEDDDKSKIFQRRFTTRPDGTGWGLYQVSEIITRGHSGFITESGTPGEGAVFWIFVPMADGDDNQSHFPAAAPLDK